MERNRRAAAVGLKWEELNCCRPLARPFQRWNPCCELPAPTSVPLRLWKHPQQLQSTWEIVFSFPIRRGTCIGWNPASAIGWPVSSHLTQQGGFKRHPQHNPVIAATMLLVHFSRHFSYTVQRFRGTHRLTDSELFEQVSNSMRFGWNFMSSKLGAKILYG
jgi:hypothetical protein